MPEVIVLKFQYMPRRRAFRVSGKGWKRIVTEQLLAKCLADMKTITARIRCEGATA